MASDKQTRARPLSPFMIGPYYKPQLTSVLSITHRATGVGLVFGLLVLVYWLVAVASGSEAHARALNTLNNPVMILLLFLWTWALFYHLCNGVRHLVWDAGYGFDIPTVYKTGKAVIVASLVLTILCWIFII